MPVRARPRGVLAQGLGEVFRCALVARALEFVHCAELARASVCEVCASLRAFVLVLVILCKFGVQCLLFSLRYTRLGMSIHSISCFETHYFVVL